MRVYSEKSGLSKDRCRLELYSHGEYSGFQVTGIIEGFFFDYAIFCGGKFWYVFLGWLGLSRDFFSIQNNLKIQW